MFTFQLKNRLTSAEPRLVMERTCSRPGTLFIASSTGRVTITCIWLIGATPLSMPTTMRGKSVAGKTATGIVNAKYTPTTIIVIMTKMMGPENRAVQCSCCSVTGGSTAVGSLIYFLPLSLSAPFWASGFFSSSAAGSSSSSAFGC